MVLIGFSWMLWSLFREQPASLPGGIDTHWLTIAMTAVGTIMLVSLGVVLTATRNWIPSRPEWAAKSATPRPRPVRCSAIR